MRRKSADGCGRLRGGLVTGAAHLQKSLNRSGAISVYRTVCWMFLCPRYCCRARVSWPSFASLNPQAWRSMWGWIGNGILAASPAGLICGHGPAGMAKDVGLDWELHHGGIPDTVNVAMDAEGADWRAALGNV